MIRPYYKGDSIEIYNQDCLEGMRGLPGDSVDLIATDPPFGYSFMGRSWDKAVIGVKTWSECLRVLKPGAFAFIFSAPRQDVLSRMVTNLQDAGFETGFSSLYHAYASGFPKAQNIGKAVDKRLGVERISLGPHPNARKTLGTVQICKKDGDGQLRPIPATPQAKALDGSYGGFQPKPAVEVILVAMKPLSEKTYVDQALKNGKGITWLDSARIPYESGDKPEGGFGGMDMGIGKPLEHQDYRGCQEANSQGRFPANLLVSDDVLNDGKVTQSGKDAIRRQEGMFVDHHLGGVGNLQVYHPDSGSFSRYFDLDAWWEKRVETLPESVKKTFPFLIVPKASKGEKNKGCEGLPEKLPRAYRTEANGTSDRPSKGMERFQGLPVKNTHPTCKPVKLMAYLITLGSRPGDLVLDPFIGSGTTSIAAKVLSRRCLGYEIDEGYCQIAAARCCYPVQSRGI